MGFFTRRYGVVSGISLLILSIEFGIILVLQIPFLFSDSSASPVTQTTLDRPGIVIPENQDQIPVIKESGWNLWEPSRPVFHQGLWYLFYMAFPVGSSWQTKAVIEYAVSPDLIIWEPRGVALSPSLEGWDSAAVHTPLVSNIGITNKWT